MNTINIRASIQNLIHTDRTQSEIHRTPVANQQQNAEASSDMALRRLHMPIQAEQGDSKNIDPSYKQKVFLTRRRQKKQQQKKRPNDQTKRNGGGRFIDIEA